MEGECTEEKKTIKEKEKKKKKKKIKTEDSDSGVDVFFREKEETTSDKKCDQVKVTHLFSKQYDWIFRDIDVQLPLWYVTQLLSECLV